VFWSAPHDLLDLADVDVLGRVAVRWYCGGVEKVGGALQNDRESDTYPAVSQSGRTDPQKFLATDHSRRLPTLQALLMI